MTASVLNANLLVTGLLTPGGRLTLASGTPVMTSDQSAKTSVYYTPYLHDYLALYNGSAWVATQFTELTLALDSASGHTGYHQSGKNFDLFVYNDSGTLRLVSGPAWTSDTARSAAVSRLNGRLTNTSSMTAKYDTSTTTLTVAANQGLLVGTIRCSADGTTTWIISSAINTEQKLYVSNLYNLVDVSAHTNDTAGTWTYSTATMRAANANNNVRVSFVRCVDDHNCFARYHAFAQSTLNASSQGITGVGLDSTTAAAKPTGVYNMGNLATAVISIQTAPAAYDGLPGIGYHYVQALERVDAGTVTFYGDGSSIGTALVFTGKF